MWVIFSTKFTLSHLNNPVSHNDHRGATPLPEETKHKLSIALKKTFENGRIPWNKDKCLSADHRRTGYN
jgi:hypothetical protein